MKRESWEPENQAMVFRLPLLFSGFFATGSTRRKASIFRKAVSVMKNIITISREFGSGGRTIGKRLADILGYSFYDRELIEKAAEETGFSEDFVQAHGEQSTLSSLFSYSFVGRGFNGMSMDDYLWSIQRKIILDIASKADTEPCVIVGRCSDYILRDREDALHAFIHADKAFRADRIVTLYGETTDAPEKRLNDKDKKRRNNYRYYTDRNWGQAQNYDICLKSSELGIDRCVDILTMLAKS